MKKGVIVFTGYNQRAVIAFLRTLEANSIEYGLIASSSADTILLTTYADRPLVVRDNPELELKDITNGILELKEKLGVDSCLVAPSTESLNRYLLENRTHFEKIGCEIPLTDKNLYESISDKESFTQICKKSGLDVPSEYTFSANLPLPCVAKPREYSHAGGSPQSPVLLHNSGDLKLFLESHNSDEFYFQEFIEGESYYLLYYIDKEGAVVKFSQQNYVQQPQGKSIIAAKTAGIHTNEVSRRYEELLVDLGFRGLIMIEVKKMQEKYYMIEANPRMWGPSQLFVDAGVNLFESLLCDFSMDTKHDSSEPKEVNYFWEGGLSVVKNNYDKLSYHGYDRDRFVSDMIEWQQYDIYNRGDTVKLYISEVEGSNERE